MDPTANTDPRDLTPSSGSGRPRRTRKERQNKSTPKTQPNTEGELPVEDPVLDPNTNDDITEGPIKGTIYPVYKLLRNTIWSF
jgi:hypothetical protein